MVRHKSHTFIYSRTKSNILFFQKLNCHLFTHSKTKNDHFSFLKLYNFNIKKDNLTTIKSLIFTY